MSVLKRQREVKKAEKARAKRAKQHGTIEEGFTEPRPTVSFAELEARAAEAAEEESDPDAT
jgi:hypothetical protein